MFSFLTWWCHSHSNLHPLCQDHQPWVGWYSAVWWWKAVQLESAEVDQISEIWSGMSWNTGERKKPMTWPFPSTTACGWTPSCMSLAADQITLCPGAEGVLSFNHWPKQISRKGECQDCNFKNLLFWFSHSGLGIYMWHMMYKYCCFSGLGCFLGVDLRSWEWNQLPLTSFLSRLEPLCYEKSNE